MQRKRALLHVIVIVFTVFTLDILYAHAQTWCNGANCIFLPATSFTKADDLPAIHLQNEVAERYQDNITLSAEIVNSSSETLYRPVITWIFRSNKGEIIRTMQVQSEKFIYAPGEKFTVGNVYTGAPFEVEAKSEYLISWKTEGDPRWIEMPLDFSVIGTDSGVMNDNNYWTVEFTAYNPNDVPVEIYAQHLAAYDSEGNLRRVYQLNGYGSCTGCSSRLYPNESRTVKGFVREYYGKSDDFRTIDLGNAVIYGYGHGQYVE